ncbi:MAG TPA: class I SAM-dependent methyltransferase, partial [bacterium]|nr:class I SAM-dependent methyltransferase [bacterium]
AFRPLYRLYLVRVLPALARLFARNGAGYQYLSDSIRAFPAPAAFAAVMRDAGLKGVPWYPLTFGSAYLHVGRVPGGA